MWTRKALAPHLTTMERRLRSVRELIAEVRVSAESLELADFDSSVDRLAMAYLEGDAGLAVVHARIERANGGAK